MRKGTDLIGQSIIAYDSGAKLATVKDLIFSQDQSALVALLTDEPSWFSSGKVVLIAHIQAIGPDGILIKSADSIMPISKVPSVQALLGRENILRGTEIMTVNGRNLGKMIDLYFDASTGSVEGYEVSGGLFTDAYTGRSFVPSDDTFRIGQDFAFVPHSVVELMEEQVGGIKAAVTATGEKAKNIAQKASHKAQEVGQTVNEKAGAMQSQAMTTITDAVVTPKEQKQFALGRTIQSDVKHPNGSIFLQKNQTVIESDLEQAQSLGILDEVYRATDGEIVAAAKRRANQKAEQLSSAVSATIDKTTQKTQAAMATYAIEETIGHRIQSMVRGDDGEIIAATGQIVTQRTIDKAREYGQEKALISATGLSTQEAAKRQSTLIAEDKAAQIQEVGEQVQHHASSALEWAKQTADELFDKSSSEIEKHRIRSALGRPVNRVIFDTQDNIVLNVGELVTHNAVKSARQAGVLDILLNSIHQEVPDINSYEMPHSQNGHKSLVNTNSR
ncbi:PRC-barrel domain-containing protein [filamentous cyanobacterium LEGE 11480]|uniref:PRC-barrel domain-containing protein n=1 Tax=Romeriopsis navalis LEGE 11480 TaxID=2777977 RepID=A0A928VMP6_9CYAN|nr:PRC-barrel domain-containing protein [Romeriopsis navalis]MBE9031438.1 PRC-barrel domain-containing protein [Romeriopsis navalis LEGE 11480]